MKILILFLLLLLTINTVNANEILFIGWTPNQTNVKNYEDQINRLEGKCVNPLTNSYSAAQCHFNLSYYYIMLFREIALNVEEEGLPFEAITTERQLLLINKSNEHLLEVINISWSNLTVEDYEKNDKGGFLTGSLFLLVGNYLDLKDYERAHQYLDIITTMMDFYPNSNKMLVEMYNRFYSLLPQKPKVELIGDIDPLFFSSPQIKPRIILKSEGDPSFNKLSVNYFDLQGFNTEVIEKEDSLFIFNEKIILEKNYGLFFPYDKIYARLYNVSPPRIRENSTAIDLDESINFYGTAYFKENEINLIFERKSSYKILVLINTIFLILGLFFLNKRIKHMRKESFEPKNLIKEWWPLLISILALARFISYDFRIDVSLLNILIFSLLMFTTIKFYLKRKKLFSISTHNKIIQ